MEIIYRTDDGKEFYSKKEAERHEKEVAEESAETYNAVVSVTGFFQIRNFKGFDPQSVAEDIYNNLEELVEVGDLNIDEADVAVFDSNDKEYDFSGYELG